ncbi:unannotated protein [freshwater metagenome]|uniref:Unannotated protein n=1 Tax=freshwater metagenome TaxID=449393 RepID=A0A6J7CXT2_9ZZZZ
MLGRVLFIANGARGSAAATRAERIAAALQPADTLILLRNGASRRSAAGLVRRARAFDADLVYCVDLAVVPLAVALLSHPRTSMIVDTGDHPSAYFRQIRAPRWKQWTARVMEELAYRQSAGMVVRGPHHEAVLRGHGVTNIRLVPDGVDLAAVQAVPDPSLRSTLGLADVFTIGIAGRFTWHEAMGGGLGSEVVQTLARIRDLPVHAVLIGEGPGLAHLRLLAVELGVSDRLHILGPVPYTDYGRYVSLIDVALITQTNDPSSWVRTTGKLPGYLALGRYILASAVGTAVGVLPDEMLVPYHGAWDPGYPDRLAERIRDLVAHPARLQAGAALTALAEPFSYDTISQQAAAFIREILDRATP